MAVGAQNAGMTAARRLATVAMLAAATLAGCTSVTSGGGSAAPSTSGQSSGGSDFPSSRAPSSSPTRAAPPSPPSGTPTVQQRGQVLGALAGSDELSALVAVPGGYEAASIDQRGRVRFWFDPAASLRWQRIGASRYPYAPQLGPPGASVNGALLRNMKHATFIVIGRFTTDTSGNAVAFTTGPRGWGAIKAERNGDIGPSGRPVGRDRIGLSYGFDFDHGYLVTADCPTDRPIAQCSRHVIVKRWVWTGSDFHRG
jgi:hypothetical protein